MLDNINPKIWGEYFWATGFLVAYSYPNNPSFEDRETVLNFFNQFKKILPCEKCRFNFSSHLFKYPLDDKALTNKNTLINWFLNIHNEVNIMLGKNKLTIDDIYSKYYGITTDNKKTIITTLLIFSIIIILILYIIIRRTCY